MAALFDELAMVVIGHEGLGAPKFSDDDWEYGQRC